jgi:hypothetical protein
MCSLGNQYERALAFRTDLQLDEIIEIANGCRPGMARKAKSNRCPEMDCVSNDAEVGARARLRAERDISFILTIDRHRSWHFVKEVPASLGSHFVETGKQGPASGIAKN